MNRSTTSLLIALAASFSGCNWLFDLAVEPLSHASVSEAGAGGSTDAGITETWTSSDTSLHTGGRVDASVSQPASASSSGSSGDPLESASSTLPTTASETEATSSAASDGSAFESSSATPATSSSSAVSATSDDDPLCGNGTLDEGEGCDDHDREPFDGCNSACQGEEWLLTVNGALTPAFEPGIVKYHVQLPLFVDELRLNVRAGDADVVISGETLTDGHWRSGVLPLGESVATFDVVAGDAVDRTYELHVTRGQPTELYFKASNAGAVDAFGDSVALSADGNTLAVGARWEDGSVASDGSPGGADELAEDAGAVYVFQRDPSGVWVQEAFLKGYSTNAFDRFGESVALSADGNTLAVGASSESGGGHSVSNDASAVDSKPFSGAAFVFVRAAGVWKQQAYIKASNSGQGDDFGHALSLSADGNTLAVSAPAEAGSKGGVGDGRLSDNLAALSGAVYVFLRGSTGAWSQEVYIKADQPAATDFFGKSVAVSGDGNTLAVGAYWADHVLEAVDPPPDAGLAEPHVNRVSNAGAAYVFARGEDSKWRQQVKLEASSIGESSEFGFSVALDGDGNTLAVGARQEDLFLPSSEDGTTAGDIVYNGGAIHVFTREADMWAHSAHLKPHNVGNNHNFGYSVSLTADGTRMAVGSVQEDGSGTLVSDGRNANDAAYESGAVYVFFREPFGWRQHRYVKAVNTGDFDYFGWSVAFSGDGNTLAASAYGEDGSESGLDANPNVNGASNAGAVYVVQ